MSRHEPEADADGIITGDMVVERGKTIKGIRAVSGNIYMHIGGYMPDLLFVGGRVHSGRQDCLLEALSVIEDQDVISRAFPAFVAQGLGAESATAAGRAHAASKKAATDAIRTVEPGSPEKSGLSL